MKDVTIYSTTTCSFCHVLEEWLKAHDIAYTKKVADTDPAVMTEFMNVNDGAMAVPLTVIKDKSGNTEAKVTGFDKAKLAQALGL